MCGTSQRRLFGHFPRNGSDIADEEVRLSFPPKRTVLGEVGILNGNLGRRLAGERGGIDEMESQLRKKTVRGLCKSLSLSALSR